MEIERQLRRCDSSNFFDGTALTTRSTTTAFSASPAASSSRRNWMELERQLRDRDSSDSEDGIVRNPQDFNMWPVRRLRTHIDYDNLLCCAGYNLRCVKWGPKDGIWEHYWTPMVAQGPPNGHAN